MPDAYKEFGELFASTAHRWRQRLDAKLREDPQLRPYSLTTAKWRVLLRLHRAPEGLSQSKLAEMVGVEGPTIVGLIDRLELDGLVERRPCPADRRSKIVHLQPAGEALAPRLEAHVEQVRHEALGGIPPEAMQQCHAVLVAVRDALTALNRPKQE